MSGEVARPVVAGVMGGVLVLTGYGLHVGVDHGHLVWSDGIGRNRRSGKLNRATCDLKRLVVLGHSGTISFEALRWLHDIGASFVQFDADGTVIVANGPCGLDDARLRRAQALGSTNGIGESIRRSLLEGKIDGQHALLARIAGTEQFQAAILQARDQLATASNPSTLRLVEAQAANAYWAAWSSQAIRFSKRDASLVPTHWLTFGQRRSEITGRSRLASNPINALLNYLYAILETEVRLAILAMGLDPGLGIIHADQKSRDSFVFDLIEPLRPQADGYLLTLLQDRTFTAKEFFETREGVCRLMPPLTTMLAEASPIFAKLAAPMVEKVAYRLGRTVQEAGKSLTVPTLLTQANRSDGRAAVRVNTPKQAKTEKLSKTTACRECGVVLSGPAKHYCEVCLPVYKDSHVEMFSEAGRAKMAELRAAGKDPSKGGKNAEIRAAKIRQRREDQRAWEAENEEGTNHEAFSRDILPQLQRVSLTLLANATGLSVQYCSLIRRGRSVPHPRHWEALKKLSH